MQIVRKRTLTSSTRDAKMKTLKTPSAISQIIIDHSEKWDGCEWETGLDGDAHTEYVKNVESHAAEYTQKLIDASAAEFYADAVELLESAKSIELQYGDTPAFFDLMSEIKKAVESMHYSVTDMDYLGSYDDHSEYIDWLVEIDPCGMAACTYREYLRDGTMTVFPDQVSDADDFAAIDD